MKALQLAWIWAGLLLFAMQVFASDEQGIPFIKNYKPGDYEGSSENWSIVQDHRGVMYFANTNGVLVFDGKKWRLHPLPNFSLVRSLAIDDRGVIYVGGVGEFGYLAIDPKGRVHYVSLSAKLPEKERDFKNVWRVHTTSHGVYFDAEDKFFRYRHGKIDLMIAGASYISGKVFDAVIFRRQDQGLFIIKDGRESLLPYTQDLTRVSADRLVVLAYTNDKLLIVSQHRGMFVYAVGAFLEKGSFIANISEKGVSPDILTKLPGGIYEYLSKHDLYHGVKIDENRFALTTVMGGIVFMDKSGRLDAVIDKKRGLVGNFISYLYKDREGNLWAAANNGISYLETSSPITLYDERYGVMESPMAVVMHFDTLYLSTILGVQYYSMLPSGIPKEKLGFQPVAGTKDCWDFMPVGDVLFAGGRGGVSQIKDGLARDMRVEGFVYSLGRSKKFPDVVFLGKRKGLAALRLKNARADTDLGRGFYEAQHINFDQSVINDIIRKIVSDPSGDLWITTRYQGVLYIRFTGKDLDAYEVYRFDVRHGLPRNDWNYVHVFDDQIVVAGVDGVYRAILPADFRSDPLGVRFVPHDLFGDIIKNGAVSISHIHRDAHGNYLVQTGQGMGLLKKDHSGVFQWDQSAYRKLKVRDSNFTVDTNGIVWVLGQGEVYRFDQSAEMSRKSKFHALIRQVKIQDGTVLFFGNYVDENSLVENVYSIASVSPPSFLKPTLDYHQNSIAFEYCATYYEHALENQFRYKLDGFDKDWSAWSPATKKEYTNLSEGRYRFRVIAKNIFDHESSVAEYSFVVFPPWYRTYLAYFGYVVVFVLVLLGGIKFNTRRLMAAKRRLEGIVDDRTRQVRKQKEQLEIKNTQISQAYSELEQTHHTLKRTQNQLLDASWKAGMADVASNVLHNIGNVLNSLMVTHSLLRDKLKSSRIGNLRKAAALNKEYMSGLVELAEQPSKGRSIIEYLSKLADHLCAEHDLYQKDISHFEKDLERVTSSVSKQQVYAEMRSKPERLGPQELVDLAMELSPLSSRSDVQIDYDFRCHDPILVDRHKVVQVLIALLSCMEKSLDSSYLIEKRMEITVEKTDHDCIRFAIVGIAAGMDPEKLNDLFRFDSEPSSDSQALSLHASANAAKSMGGRIMADSQGAGLDGRFILDIPIV